MTRQERNEYQRKWREANREKVRQYKAERRRLGLDKKPSKEARKRHNDNHRRKFPDESADYSKTRRLEITRETMEEYGGKCECCGESTMLFLTIDHINNDGAEQRRAIGDGPVAGKHKGRAGVNFYRWLKKHEYPKEGYRILCFNCNCGRARNGGICPHKEI